MKLKKKITDKKTSKLQKRVPAQLERKRSIIGDPKKQLSGLMDYNRNFSI